jgi:tRNA dimethylallyltransferase
VGEMFAAGWEAETAALAGQVPADAPAWNATGYAAIRSLVEGALARDAAIARIEAGTRQYAKRQRTWIRHQLPAADVTHLDPARSDAVARAIAWWEGDPRGEGTG